MPDIHRLVGKKEPNLSKNVNLLILNSLPRASWNVSTANSDAYKNSFHCYCFVSKQVPQSHYQSGIIVIVEYYYCIDSDDKFN